MYFLNRFTFYSFPFFALVLLCLAPPLAKHTHASGEPSWSIRSSFTPHTVSFTHDDSYVVLESAEAYEVWNTEDQKKVLSGEYRKKFSRRIPGVYLNEGSASVLFEREEVFLQFDYTLRNTEVQAFDLKTGEQIWSIDNLDIGISTAEAIYSVLDNAKRISEDNTAIAATTLTIADAPGTVRKRGEGLQELSYIVNDETISKLINYLPERHAIAINGKDALQLLDIKTGTIIWSQPELRGGLGEVFYEPNNDMLIAIRVNQGEIKNIIAKPEVQALNGKTGDLIWTANYNGNFIPEVSFVLNETLVLPFYGLVFIDIKTGEVREGDVFEAMKRSQRMLRNASVLGGGDTEGYGENTSYPFLDENGVLHYVAGYRGGKHMDPDGGKKAYFQIDIHQDKFLKVVPDIAKGGNANRIIQEEVVGDILYLKTTKGFTDAYIMAIDTKEGKVMFETKELSNRLGTDFDAFQMNRDQIIDASSKGIHFFDARTGKEQHMVSYKDLGVGKLRNQIFFDRGLVLIGTNGVAIADKEGEVKATFSDLDNIRELRIGDEIWLVENRLFSRLSTEPIEILEQTKFSGKENIFFSPSGRYLVRADESGRNMGIYIM